MFRQTLLFIVIAKCTIRLCCICMESQI